MNPPCEPPVVITITDEKSLLKALRTVLELTYREFVIAHEEAQDRKIEEN